MALFEQTLISILTLSIWTIRYYLDASAVQLELLATFPCLLWTSASSKLKLLGFGWLIQLRPSFQRWISDRLTSLSGRPWKIEESKKEVKQMWTPPLLYPSRTAHARFGPKIHSFSYSYLMVGIPVMAKEVLVNNMLAVDTIHSTRSWYQVTSEDHLYRISSPTDLRTQVDDFLKLQVLSPRSATFQ
jgi:hypothetical protein